MKAVETSRYSELKNINSIDRAYEEKENNNNNHY